MICDAYMPLRWYKANLAVFFALFCNIWNGFKNLTKITQIFKDNKEFILDSEKC